MNTEFLRSTASTNSESIERDNFKRFVDIQIAFAAKAAQINRISKEEALLQYTAIYRNVLGLPSPITKDDPTWKEFVRQCVSTDDIAQSTWDFVQRLERGRTSEQGNRFDPFSYRYDAQAATIVLHFGGEDQSIDIRHGSRLRAKLTMMFDEIRRSHPEATHVEAYSWLIRFAARIFPREFIASAVPQRGWFKTEAIWGQFKTGSSIRERAVRVFLEKVERAESVQDLQEAFPYQSLHARCDIRYFHNFQ